MLLYLGYLLVQVFPIIDKFTQSNMATSAIVFSIVVFLIWSFIPVTGYFLAKLMKANGYLSKRLLFGVGVLIAIIENSLFYLHILTYEQSFTGTFVVFILFFISAYISVSNKHINDTH